AVSAAPNLRSSTVSFTARPKPPPSRGPIDTAQVTFALVAFFFWCEATKSRAPPKHAAYPAAKRCSGVAVSGLPGPPIAFGTERSALTEPSLASVCPLRPPIAVAVAVKSGLIVFISPPLPVQCERGGLALVCDPDIGGMPVGWSNVDHAPERVNHRWGCRRSWHRRCGRMRVGPQNVRQRVWRSDDGVHRPRQRDHPAATGRQHGPRRRRVLVERDMRAVGVVVGHVLAKQVVGEERAQVCEGGWNRRGSRRDTVPSLTTKPSLSSSPWMRGAPQPTLSRAISRMRVTRFYYVCPCARATLATTTTSSSGSIGLTTCAL